MKSKGFFLYWLIPSCLKLSLNKPVYQQALPDVHVIINVLSMSKGILWGDVKICCTVYFQLFYPTCLLQQNKPLIILCFRNDSQFVSFWLTAGPGRTKFTIINLSCCQGTQVLNNKWLSWNIYTSCEHDNHSAGPETAQLLSP